MFSDLGELGWLLGSLGILQLTGHSLPSSYQGLIEVESVFRTSSKLLVGKISCRLNFSSLYLQFKSRLPLLCELFNSLNKSFSAGTSFTHFPIQIIPLFPLSETSEMEYFLAVYNTYRNNNAFLCQFSQSALRNIRFLTCAVLQSITENT